MLKFIKTTNEIEAEKTDGNVAYDEFIAAEKKRKRNRRIVKAAAAIAVTAIALKYISTPVPEWADDSEDV